MYLKAKIPGAPNFTYGEFLKSSTALRKNIDNTPNEAQWGCIEALAQKILQPLREEFGGIRITSGFRSIALCEAIGSNKYSNHARGQASDIEPLISTVSLMDIVNFVYSELDYRELIAEFFPNGWCHIAYRENGNVRRLKLKDKDHNYTKVTIKELNKLY